METRASDALGDGTLPDEDPARLAAVIGAALGVLVANLLALVMARPLARVAPAAALRTE